MALSRMQDTELLKAALIGFQQMRDQVEQKIADLRGRIDGRTSPASASGSAAAFAPKKRTMSASARQRIAMAQKKRWAAYKAAKGRTAAAKPQKRVLSAAGRARIVAATKKRWAAFRKAKGIKKSG